MPILALVFTFDVDEVNNLVPSVSGNYRWIGYINVVSLSDKMIFSFKETNKCFFLKCKTRLSNYFP